jgi:hypothetical protein
MATPNALTSLLWSTAQLSLLFNTTTGFPLSLGLNSLAQLTSKLFTLMRTIWQI